MNFGVAKKVILGKYHLAIHSAKNVCRKKSSMKILGTKNSAAGKGLTIKGPARSKTIGDLMELHEVRRESMDYI
jgi:hypothetical protein